MTQRSQFNERYSEENKPKGVTRKSAGTAKPKSAAAASVYIPAEKTKEQKKAERKKREREERDKQERAGAILADKKKDPSSPLIKRWRTMWWICLVAAIALTLLSWFGQDKMPMEVSGLVLVLAYAFIIGALYLDLGKIRKERRRLEETAKNTKANKAERRAQKAERREALKQAEAQIEAEKNKSNSGAGSLGGLFSRSKDKAVKAADDVVEKQQAAKSDK